MVLDCSVLTNMAAGCVWAICVLLCVGVFLCFILCLFCFILVCFVCLFVVYVALFYFACLFVCCVCVCVFCVWSVSGLLTNGRRR